MYNFAIYIYGIAVTIACLFNKKARLMVKGHYSTFKQIKKQINPSVNYIWVHAASLGEFEQGRMLMEQIKELYPKYKILLTFFSPSGYEVRKNYEGADIVCYLPFDTGFNARRFVNMVNPAMAFFIKYEFWTNYLTQLKKKNIPVYSVASIFRPQQIFFKSYGKQYSKVLRCFTHFFVQNEESVELLASKGLHNVTIVGDTRFDRVIQIRDKAPEISLAAAFASSSKSNPDNYIMVAGSSWPADEDILIDYFNHHPEMRLILAPHVVNEDHLNAIENKLTRRSVRFTASSEESVAQADCLIIDCYGLLSAIYRYGKRAYVGGGFGVGIHNVPEAAVYGIPVVIGPNNKKFREVQELLNQGGCFEINSKEDFADIMQRLSDEEYCHQAGLMAQEYIQSGAGAVAKVMAAIKFEN